MSDSRDNEQRSSGSTPNDVVVVGAGAIGLTIAWRLSHRGLRTIVLDAGEPAGGATGVAAGMLAPVTEADFGEEALVELNLAAARRYPDFVAELEAESGHATGYRATGALHVAIDRDQAEELARLHDLQRSLGLEAVWLSGRECRALEPGLATRAVGAIHAPGDHAVSPRSLAAALRSALDRRGAHVRPFTRVSGFVVEGGEVRGVALESGEEIASRAVVCCAGARTAELARSAGEEIPVRPVKGQILRLAGNPAQPLATRVIRTPEVYAVPRDDGRLVVGATVEERGFDATVTAGAVLELLRRVYEVLPGVTELELLGASAGHRPAAPDNRPIVGEGSTPGLVWATGHWRNGILLAPVTADAVAALITEGSPGALLEPFAPTRFATPALAAGVGAR